MKYKHIIIKHLRKKNTILDMGICSSSNRPPAKFVGVWSNGDTVRMRIWENGLINYRKEVFSALEHSCL
jgi:hypothetical protein